VEKKKIVEGILTNKFKHGSNQRPQILLVTFDHRNESVES
jgi:hypothetical protein